MDYEWETKEDKTIPEQIRDKTYVDNQDAFITQREIIRKIILGHPEGITDQEISLFTGFSLSSVNGRRNELNAIPINICIYTDERGNSHMRTMWGIIDNK